MGPCQSLSWCMLTLHWGFRKMRAETKVGLAIGAMVVFLFLTLVVPMMT